jgi:hypothetical protein
MHTAFIMMSTPKLASAYLHELTQCYKGIMTAR